ncbi:glycosyltransferase [Quadrisphaera setariae]|uniref:Glycosyltransferase n=1 Tax=Quadrisphaera setariae TaxID=2593304 RepID=A0A5C8ZEB6_9ACTN|nr:glycosyltransferase [Quadrisphaera setariae]TXR56395.1 glycosyltransferase [Quadrisphaera setariae]
MSRRTAVLLVEAHLEESGGVRVTHELVRRLPGEGLPARLFVLQRTPPGHPVLVPAPSVDVVHGSSRPRQLRWTLLPGLVRLVREARRCDVVVSGSEIGYGFLSAWLAARLAGRPFAVVVQSQLSQALHEWVPRRLHRLTRWVHSRSDLALCVSAGLVPSVVAAGLPESRTAVVPVGVDVEAVRRAALSPPGDAVASALDDGPLVVAAGRLSSSKGFDVLLRAWAQARESSPAVRPQRLLLLGEGAEREHLEALVDQLGLGGSVRLPGFSTDLQAALAGAELFVLSSRYEGMGSFVLLEAMAHGTPVVATDCPSGPRELLRDGELGALVPVEDVEALARALAAHAEDPSRLRATAEQRRRRAEEFAPQRWVAAAARELAPLVGPVRRERDPQPVRR